MYMRYYDYINVFGIEAPTSETVRYIRLYHHGLSLLDMSLLRRCVALELFLQAEVEYKIRWLAIFRFMAYQEAHGRHSRSFVGISAGDEVTLR